MSDQERPSSAQHPSNAHRPSGEQRPAENPEPQQAGQTGPLPGPSPDPLPGPLPNPHATGQHPSQPPHTTSFEQSRTLRDANPSSRAKTRGGTAVRRDEPARSRDVARVAVPRWFLLTLALLVVALVATVVVLGVRTCSLVHQVETEPVPAEWVCPYDWNNLATLSNGMLAYYVDGQLASEAGVDVSEHDGAIDWQTVKASGVDFAMIRLGYRGYGPEGTIVLDSYFLDNIVGAKEAGLKVGVYFFSQAISADEAREEARYVLDQLEQVGVELDYPIAFDQEPITNGDVARTDGISNSQLTENAVAFCQEIERAGYTPMIYGNQHDLAKLDLTGELAGYDVWLAEYETDAPTAETDYVMWQYTENGTVSGIPTSAGWVDLNIRFLVE